MKKNIKHLYKIFALFLGLTMVLVSCEEKISKDWDVELFDKGQVDVSVSSTSINHTESVTYTDNSTKVFSRKWTFDGGSPSSSTDAEVAVAYAYGGVWDAVLEVKFVDNSTAKETFQITVDGPAAPTSFPYTGTPISLPGVIEAEDYNLGTEGNAYYDTDAGNNAVTAGSPVYRTDHDTEGNVDVQVNNPGVTNLGWTSAGEWMNYTVNVTSAGVYTLDFALASDPGGYSIQVSKISGEDTTFIAESGDFSTTGGWGVYKSFKARAELEAGEQVWHVYFTGGSTNLDKITVTEGEPVIDPEVVIEASSTLIDAGQTVTFTDLSTVVDTRTWKFEGGNPATSSDEVVEVTYATAGKYNATIDITHTDGSTGTASIEITVLDPNAEVLPLAFYTERTEVGGLAMDTSNPNDTDRPSPANSSNFILSYVTDAAEGNEAIYANCDPGNSGNDQTWGSMVSMYSVNSPLDLSRHNYYNISLKVPSENTKSLRLRLRTSDGNFWVVLSDQYGFARDGQWHTLKIPFSDMLENGSGDALGAERAEVTEIIFRSHDDWVSTENFDWYIDDIYFTAE